ncbi:MAG: O-antigen ligase family protein, partial [Dehalococcoidia bacterium]|nr:O-antigen ligase family protein [Dehalococcoidia bacterium]
FMVAAGLTTWGRLDRLVSVMIATSVPVSLYGWMQHFGLDPLPWGGDVRERIAGPAGNAIFLSAYLILVVPFIVARILTIVERMRSSREARREQKSWGLLSLYSVALLIDLLAIYWTFSRGPWLGLVAGLVVFCFFWGIGARQWKIVGGAIAAAVMAVAFLVVLNLPNSPLAPLRDANRFLERLSTIADVESGTNRVRVLIWFGDGVGRGAAGLITADPWRTIVGYGPESMYVAYNRFYPPALANIESRTATPDRSHNDLLDFLVTNGVIGLFAYLFAVVSIYAVAFQLVRVAQPGYQRFMVLAVIGAVTAHLVESLLGIPIVATRTHFWMIMGMGAALPALMGVTTPRPVEAAAVAPTGPSAPASPKGQAARTRQQERERRRAAQALASRRTTSRNSLLPRLLPFGWVAATAVIVALLLFRQDFVAALGRDNFPAVMVFGGFAWVWLGITLFALALPLPPMSMTQTNNPAALGLAPLLVIVALVGAVQFGNSVVADIWFKQAQSADGQQRYDLSIPLYFRAIQAAPNEDFYFLFLGRAFLESARRAQENAPARQPQTVRDLQAMLPNPTAFNRETLYLAANVALREAYRLSPLNTDHSANLGRLYRFWAEQTPDPVLRAQRLSESDRNYANALRLSPNAAHLWTEWGITEEAQGNSSAAIERYSRAIQLDRLYAPSFLQLANLYLGQANTLINQGDREGAGPLIDKAEQNYRQVIANDPNQAAALNALGYIMSLKGNTFEAIQFNEQVRNLAPNDFATRRNLSLLYRDVGQRTRALDEARFALTIAPIDQRPQIQALIQELERVP